MATEDSKASDGAHCLYRDVERGFTTAESGGSFRACSQEFLQTMVDDLLELRKLCIITRDINDDAVEETLAVIGDEINRLDENPELFPSEELRQKFFRFVHQVFQAWNAAFEKLKTAEMKHVKLIDQAVTAEEQFTRHAYTVNRKPWQQFLHNTAPGSGVRAHEMNQGGFTQIIPLGGSKLLDSWKTENENTMKGIIPVHENAPLIEGDSLAEPEHGQGHCNIRLVLGPEPIFDYTDHATRERESVGRPTKLATLNLDFWDFEARVNEGRVANGRLFALVHETART